MENIHVQHWNEEKFLNSKKEWNDLLKHSNSDQLFLSWEWQSTWWKTFADSKSMELNLVTATTDDGTLVGIAPLYLVTTAIRNFIKIKRLQFIGNCWRGVPTMLTELMDFIVDKTVASSVIRALCAHISSLQYWDEFIFPSLDTQSETYRLLLNDNLFPNCYLRHAEEYNSYYLKLDRQFQDYTQSLGKNTRLKLFNRRNILNSLGDVTFDRMQADDIDEMFKSLNSLHRTRWNKPIFEGERLKFNTMVARSLAERGCLNFSILSLNKRPISIQYNFIVDNHNYNIQAGFDTSLHKKISLGYLHFGYEIEASFNQQCTKYDFLAGEGKNTQYKKRLTNDYQEMVDLQIVRRPTLKMLYKFYDLMR